MKRTQVMGGLLAAVAICCLALPGDLLATKRGNGSDAPATPGNYALSYFSPLPGGQWTAPFAMNNSTEIVGSCRINNLLHACLYSYNTDTVIALNDKFNNDNLTAPDGSAFDGQNGWLVTHASDINDAGQIVCYLDDFSGGTSQATVAARYTPGSTNAAARLDFLDPGGASAINNQGDIVGGGFLWTDAYIDQNGWLIANPLPHSSVDVNDRNASGQIQIIGDNRRYTVDISTLTISDDFDIGSLYRKSKYAKDYEVCINNSGDVAAFSNKSWFGGTTQEASRYSDSDGLIGLGTYGDDLSWSGGMNNFGDIAGTYATSAGEWHLFLYSDAFGGMTDLSALFPGVPLANGSLGPYGINDNGEICGGGFLLIPQP